jgi:hypothetical protein
VIHARPDSWQAFKPPKLHSYDTGLRLSRTASGYLAILYHGPFINQGGITMQ